LIYILPMSAIGGLARPKVLSCGDHFPSNLKAKPDKNPIVDHKSLPSS
jgi:hypothetical protein